MVVPDKIQRKVGRAGNGIRRLILSQTVTVRPRHDLVRLGSRYGGWVVPSSQMSENSVCYCAGVGEDATFDLALIQAFGCTVHAFDPTPRSRTYVETDVGGERRFVFHPYGLWSEDSTVRFYAPRDPDAVSHSVVNLQRTDQFFEADVRTVTSIMRELGHAAIDLLKIDIEGAEYAVLGDLLDRNVPVRIICVEFDQPAPVRKTLAIVRRLAVAGYDPVNVEGWNYTFVHRDAAPAAAQANGAKR